MTDHDRLLPVPDDDALDAAASAVVDGVATSDQEAAIAAAPDGAARVAAHRAVAGLVGSPVGEQSPRAAASGLAAALAVFGEETFHADRPLAPIAPIAPARSRWPLPRLGAVAAALLLLVGIGTFAVAMLGSGGSNDGTTFSAAPPAKDAARDATAGALERAQGSTDSGGPLPAPAAPAGPEATAGAAAGAAAAPTFNALAAAPPPAVVDGGDIGRQTDADAVGQRVSTALNGTPTVAATAGQTALPREIQACATAAPTSAPESLGALRYRATGSFGGAPAVFLAYDRPAASPPYLLLILARDGCSLLATSHF